jgi:ferredoxin
MQLGPVGVFISNMRFVGGKHAFAFCTHGSIPELFFPAIVPRLKRKGLIVIGTRHWYGNVYLLHMPEPYPTAGHPDEIDLKEAEYFGEEMVDHSQRISAGETGLIPPAPIAMRQQPNKTDLGISSVTTPGAFPSMLKFHKEKCIYPKCRLCMENCPMDGIDLTVNPPVLAKPCISCEFCARLCPTGALDMDAWVEAVSAFTAKLMPLQMLPDLEKAEAEGHFRRLLPVKELKLDTYGYMAHKKHPQWVIGKGPQ